ncbi:hypothetical protein ACIBEJ_08900 [Nonomuraea sp. NPDC050790]|uniref:hypothetical protein n=1 Tax=Nonomuraea sp. NPDC050790 TaxID=3364371 RepID=UPI00378A513B
MNGFSFFTGTWNIHNRRLVKWLAGADEWEEFPGRTVASSHFAGGAHFDEVEFPTKGFSGLTVRLFDVDEQRWTIHWASTRTGRFDPPMTGTWEGDRGEFYGDDQHQGTPVRARFIWTRLGDGEARWEQAFSVDGEKTWETNWIMELTRAD